MLAYCQLDKFKWNSNLNSIINSHSRKCIWNCRLPKWRLFCPGGEELNSTTVWFVKLARLRPFCVGFNTDLILTQVWVRQVCIFYWTNVTRINTPTPVCSLGIAPSPATAEPAVRVQHLLAVLSCCYGDRHLARRSPRVYTVSDKRTKGKCAGRRLIPV